MVVPQHKKTRESNFQGVQKENYVGDITLKIKKYSMLVTQICSKNNFSFVPMKIWHAKNVKDLKNCKSLGH